MSESTDTMWTKSTGRTKPIKTKTSIIKPTNGGGSGASTIPAPVISGPKFVIYVDLAKSWNNMAMSINVPGHAIKKRYNVMILAFWLTAKPWDIAEAWTKLDASTRSSYLDAYHKAGMILMVSAFGATESPIAQDPTAVANKFAKFVTDYHFDGADVDYEDSKSFTNNKGAQWLTTFTTKLRELLPSPRYVITHAPQGPYFYPKYYADNAYITINKNVGRLIDWYNVQYYNQGSSSYDTFTSLFTKANGWARNTSVFETEASGVPLNKIIVGKPLIQGSAGSTGLMSTKELLKCLKQGVAKGWNGGVMGWQYISDVNGTWINTLATAFSASAPTTQIIETNE